jgi:hypothetical protein
VSRNTHMKIKRLKQLIVLMALVVAALSCKKEPTKEAIKPAPPVEQPGTQIVGAAQVATLEQQKRFNHNTQAHKQQDCKLCHQRTSNDPSPTFPGHSACIGCHVRDFTSEQASSKLCIVCHNMKAGLVKPPLLSFPKLSQFGIRGFSHRDHMDRSKMPAGTAAPECTSCHRFDSRGIQVSFPSHPECYNCHTHQAGQKLGECSTCHADVAVAAKFRRGLQALALYNFKHGSHMKQPSVGGRCQVCHRLAEPVPKREPDILEISTSRGQRHNSACWNCHVRQRETVCTKCHVGGIPAPAL